MKKKKKDVLKIFYIKPSLKLDQSCISLGLLLEPFFDLDMKRDPKKTHIISIVTVKFRMVNVCDCCEF